ncbi:hypothetical protein, partial [Micrococcus luteus]|uniref:hypothetical protein n=1 Tax=Micrococcus luteus TaxID=1270 RepID=UPI0033E1DCDF
EHKGQPTVILAHTIKGYGLGKSFEGRNAILHGKVRAGVVVACGRRGPSRASGGRDQKSQSSSSVFSALPIT